MSRFADPTATERMVLGSCQCPGKPHEEDWIELRTELGASDVLRLGELDSIGALVLLVTDWNLLDSKGHKPDVTEDNIRRLYADTFDDLDAFIEKHVRVGTALPNGYAVRSRSSSRANGSPTRRARKVA